MLRLNEKVGSEIDLAQTVAENAILSPYTIVPKNRALLFSPLYKYFIVDLYTAAGEIGVNLPFFMQIFIKLHGFSAVKIWSIPLEGICHRSHRHSMALALLAIYVAKPCLVIELETHLCEI